MKILATAFHAKKVFFLVLYFRTLGQGKINHGCLVVKLAKTDTGMDLLGVRGGGAHPGLTH